MIDAEQQLRFRSESGGSVPLAELSRVLRSRALALGADPHEAEDLAQQAIVNVLARAPDRIEHAGYVVKAMTRLWLDRQRSLRAMGRRLRRLAEHAALRSAERHMHGAERGDVVRAAIEGLPPKQRAALMLRVVEGLGYAAIAEAIGCSEVAARASLHEARARLRRELVARGLSHES